jgi:hypothetical protein
LKKNFHAKFEVLTLLRKVETETNITPWSRVLLEKLTVSVLVKKFPAFCTNRKFIKAFKTDGHLYVL